MTPRAFGGIYENGRMMTKLTDEEKSHIVALIDQGKTRNAVAKEVGRSPGSITNIAREFDRSFDRTPTKIATDVKETWSKARRMELVGKGLKHAEDILSRVGETRELQAWMMAVGIGIDKIRLESGDVTDRRESVEPARKSLEDYFEELDRFRAQDVGSDPVQPLDKDRAD